ncbi:MAG: S8 family peptidase [Syntrophobacteraceae bacterium]|nr:S8 family peptidase [Syntrophobacteraceae bacterium]
MSNEHNFEYLPLIRRYQGRARLRGGGEPSPLTLANRIARQAHSSDLRAAALSLSANWQERKAQREGQALPAIPKDIPILLQVDPGLDLDALRKKFSFEIVAEQEEGYVIVASEDIQITPFLAMLDGFAGEVYGSATIAQVHRLFDDPDQTDRLGRILSERLMDEWGYIGNDQVYIVDIGIACAGTQEIPVRPTRGNRNTDAKWAAKQSEWSQARANAYDLWDRIKIDREEEITRFANFYHAEILHLIDGAEFDAGILPDSFTIRLKIVGKGLKDFVLNYPYVFEVVEPEDIVLPQRKVGEGTRPELAAAPTEPDADAPSVCLIDSGIQEGHVLIQPAIDQGTSHCFLPGKNAGDVGDEVGPGGHGTRVAGTILYGEVVARAGTPPLPFWIQNARVLDENNRMPVELFPPEVMRSVVERFHNGARRTRIFNHSINAQGYCRTRYMSAWAAEIDLLCAENDVLIIQSAGNLPISGQTPYLGVKDHLNAGRNYPLYLCEPSARIANPGQSLQALTVGSVAYGALEAGDWRTFAPESNYPSAFSRTGPGIWNVIKPEVVEYGDDDIRTRNQPPDVQAGGGIPLACPELVRSTMFPPGPAVDRDEAGTSFAAPKVARIAAQLQRLLPTEPALLYRALLVQSAQWPTWAENILARLRAQEFELSGEQRQKLLDNASWIIRSIGYGIPDETRSTVNTDHRTTLITSGETHIHTGECHVYQVPIPAPLRRQSDEFEIRIDVTLSYVAQPRRTRRNLRHYLSTWLDWKTSKLGEGINDFRIRVMKDTENDIEPLPGSVLPWTLQESPNSGFIRATKRNSGTVQKDWAIVRSNTLPDHFCIAVQGHQGWSRDPDSTARYALAVTFEIVGQEINIYDPLRTAVIEVQAEVEAEVNEVEVEVNEDE